jgi:hypothetical protein
VLRERLDRQTHQSGGIHREQQRQSCEHAFKRRVGVAARHDPQRARHQQPAADPVDDERASSIEIENGEHRCSEQCPVCRDETGFNQDGRAQRDAGKTCRID